jgi:transcriptional regulator with XRE-family HTH domain
MSIDNALEWYDSLEEDVGYKVESNKNAFAILLNTLMMEQGISRAGLAERTNKSAPYITKVLRGDTNLTISSMTKLLDAIDCELHLNGCHRDHELKWGKVITSGRSAEISENVVVYTNFWAKQVKHGTQAA